MALVEAGARMKSWQRNTLWGGSVLVILLALAVEFIPREDARERLLAIPDQGPGFTSRMTPLNEQEVELLGDASAVKRVVLPEGEPPFLFSAIDGSRNRHAVHDPRYCFVGAGWEITKAVPIETPRGEIMALELSRDGERRQALYWFSDGDAWFVAPTEYWMKATLRRLSFGLSGEEPVLFIVQTLEPGSVDDEVDVDLLERLDPWK